MKVNWKWPDVAVFGIVMAVGAALVISKAMEPSEVFKYLGGFVAGVLALNRPIDKQDQGS